MKGRKNGRKGLLGKKKGRDDLVSTALNRKEDTTVDKVAVNVDLLCILVYLTHNQYPITIKINLENTEKSVYLHDIFRAVDFSKGKAG